MSKIPHPLIRLGDRLASYFTSASELSPTKRSAASQQLRRRLEVKVFLEKELSLSFPANVYRDAPALETQAILDPSMTMERGLVVRLPRSVRRRLFELLVSFSSSSLLCFIIRRCFRSSSRSCPPRRSYVAECSMGSVSRHLSLSSPLPSSVPSLALVL